MSKDSVILIRVSEDEKKAFTKAAEVRGSKLSEWARQYLRAAATKELTAAGEKVAFLKKKV